MEATQPRAFRLLGESALRALRGTLARVAADWAREWGISPALVEVSVQRASDGVAARTLAWPRSVQSGGLEAWLGSSTDLGAELQRLMFAADPAFVPDSGGAPELAPAAARRALDTLLDELAEAAMPGQQSVLRSAHAPVPEYLWERGSGALLAQLAVGRQHCRILLGSAAVQARQAAPAALPALAAVDLEQSLSGVPVELRLVAGSARVGLGALLSLAPGDVVRLDRQADAPLALGTQSGHGLFDVYLGRSGEQLAVELVGRHTLLGEVK